MSVKFSPVVAALVLLSSAAARAQGGAESSPAPAPAVAACAKAYEQAQVQRKNGQLVAARHTLQLCADDACPAFVREDCDAWYTAVQNELPTLVFTAQSLGRDLTDVRISIGSRLLADRIDGQAIELDPGEYDFDFNAAGMQPLSQHLLIARGEQNRLVRVELLPLAAGDPGHDVPGGHSRRSWLLPGIFTGVGVAGLAGFGALGAWGHSSESKLQDTCSPYCSKSDISSVRTKYLLADVSLGVGIASLAAGAYFFFSSRAEAPPSHAAGLDVRASPNAVSASYGGTF